MAEKFQPEESDKASKGGAQLLEQPQLEDSSQPLDIFLHQTDAGKSVSKYLPIASLLKDFPENSEMAVLCKEFLHAPNQEARNAGKLTMAGKLTDNPRAAVLFDALCTLELVQKHVMAKNNPALPEAEKQSILTGTYTDLLIAKQLGNHGAAMVLKFCPCVAVNESVKVLCSSYAAELKKAREQSRRELIDEVVRTQAPLAFRQLSRMTLDEMVSSRSAVEMQEVSDLGKKYNIETSEVNAKQTGETKETVDSHEPYLEQDSHQRVLSFGRRGLAPVRSFTWGADGKLAYYHDEHGNKQEPIFDGQVWNQTPTFNPDGTYSEHTAASCVNWDRSGQIWSITQNANKIRHHFGYAAGRMTEYTRHIGEPPDVTTAKYNVERDCWTISNKQGTSDWKGTITANPDGTVTFQHQVDDFKKIWNTDGTNTTIQPEISQRFTHDGVLLSYTDHRKETLRFVRDNGKLITICRDQAQEFYRPVDGIITVPNKDGTTVSYSLDGKVTRVVDAQGKATDYRHRPDGRLTYEATGKVQSVMN